MKLVPVSPAGNVLNLSVTNDLWIKSPTMFCDRPLSQLAMSGLRFAADAICAQVKKDSSGIVYPPEKLVYGFMYCSEISFEFKFDPEKPNNYTFGQTLPLVLFRADLWEAFSLTPLQIAAVILEEICHLCYSIDDEYLVKVKVVQILQNLAIVDFDSLYSSMPGMPNFQ